MRSIVLALSLVLTTGCAGSYKASYVTVAVTKQFATESYEIYSTEFNKKLDECDPAANASVTTKTELDECMGKYFAKPQHEKIEFAIKVYHDAATVHSESMIAADGDKEGRKEATKAVIDSAISLLSLFPEGKHLVNKLKKLTGRK